LTTSPSSPSSGLGRAELFQRQLPEARGVGGVERVRGNAAAARRTSEVRDDDLSYEKLPIPDTDRQTLAIYHAEHSSPSARALALLATMVAGDRTLERASR
jgi:hypothetical protein